MRRKLVFIAPAAIAGILLFMAIGGVVVQLLWNWLVPTLFGWRQVTFWQAIGLLALCRILFGGLGRHGISRFEGRRRLAERMSDRMTPEEKERFRQRIRERFGFDPSASENRG